MFVTYDFSEQTSGSRVRPAMMYQAFKNIGYDVFLISGNKEKKSEQFKKLKRSKDKFELCYIEPSTYPLQPLIDYKVILYLKKLNIPVGIFYRDAYWMFGDNNMYSGLKKIELKIRHILDLKFYKRTSNIMYFPSNSMAKYFKFSQPKIALPPGALKNNKLVRYRGTESNKVTAIYVGGISKWYGPKLLLDSFQKVNKEGIRVNLILVCRKEEYTNNARLFENYVNEKWLCIRHLKGKDLNEAYSQADFSIIPILKGEYNDFAVPIKLFEYLSYGLPILATNCTEVEEIINNNKLGIVVNDNVTAFAEGLAKISQCFYIYNDNVTRFVESNGYWEHRARKVIETLNTFNK